MFEPRKRKQRPLWGRDMKKDKVFLLIQSALCILLAVLLCFTVIGMYREGLLEQAVDPLHEIFSREKVIGHLLPILPVFFLSLAVTAFGAILGIWDKNTKSTDDLRAGQVQHGSDAARKNLQRQIPLPGLRWLRLALLVLALGMIAAGVFNGSAKDVLNKAVKICTECVGLG